MGNGLFSSFEYPLVSILHNFFSVPVKMSSLYLINKAVSIHIAQLNFATILRSHVVVMKLIQLASYLGPILPAQGTMAWSS